MLEGGYGKIEGKESPEMFRASLGFDFVFAKDAQCKVNCYCVEINGHDSGIGGIADISDDDIDKSHKIIAGIRATINPDIQRKLAGNDASLPEMHDPASAPEEKVPPESTKKMSDDPLLQHAYRNPEFIENITRDKKLQERYVPSEHAPRTWHYGEPYPLIDLWVVKNKTSRGGRAIHIISRKSLIEYAQTAGKVGFENLVVQEFIMPIGAENASPSDWERPASMRLLIDFQYLRSGKVVPTFRSVYQRIAPYDIHAKYDKEGAPLNPEDIFVVNRAKGAQSVPASPKEIQMAQDVAEQIIKKIANDYGAYQSRINQSPKKSRK